VNTRCLYCGKRLSFFHSRNKPYCSDVHEDRYRERQAQTGLERLQDLYPVPAPHESPPEIQAALPPPVPKAVEQFSYDKVDPSIFEDASPLEEHSALDPPAASFLPADASVIQAAPPAFPYRDAGDAAFPEEYWGGAPDTSAALLSLGASQFGPAPITFPTVHVEPKVVEPEAVEDPQFEPDVVEPVPEAVEPVVAEPLLVEPVEPVVTQPEPPPQVTRLAQLQTRPLPLPEPIAVRVFCEPPSTIAIPGLAVRLRSLTLARVPARPETASSQPAPVECLPASQPVRFRTLLNLHNPAFQKPKRRIAPVPRVPLDWNAIPPETALWKSNPLRRPIAPVIPKLSRGVTPLSEIAGLSRQSVAPMGGPDQ
jgi:hypothetical protein